MTSVLAHFPSGFGSKTRLRGWEQLQTGKKGERSRPFKPATSPPLTPRPFPTLQLRRNILCRATLSRRGNPRMRITLLVVALDLCRTRHTMAQNDTKREQKPVQNCTSSGLNDTESRTSDPSAEAECQEMSAIVRQLKISAPRFCTMNAKQHSKIVFLHNK